MRNDYVSLVYIPFAGVASVETSWPYTECFPEDWAWPCLRGYPFKVLQGLMRCLRRKSSFSTRVVKYWSRLPTPIVTAPSVNSFKRQLDSAWEDLFAEVCRFPSFYSLSPQSVFTIGFFMLSQTLIHCHS